jgi:hypothetical protein
MKIRTTLALALFCLALAPIAATAGEQEDLQACMNDAMTVCSQFIPDRGRVASCLYSNRSRISVACRMVLARYNQPGVSPVKLTTIH